MRMRVMEVKNEYATEGKEQKDRISQTGKTKVYVIDQRVPVIPENYGEEPLYERKRPQVAEARPMTLQDRPSTPHTQAGTSAVLQRDARMTSGYTIALVGRDRESVSPHTCSEPINAWEPPLSKSDPNYVPREKNLRRQVTLGRSQPRDAGN
ncbi:hypothetical protein Q7P35_005501 [Cladosporium inversicolor]